MRYQIKKPSYENYHSSLDCLFYKHPEKYGRTFNKEFRTLRMDEIRTMSNILWLLEIHLNEYTEKVWNQSEYTQYKDKGDGINMGTSCLELIFLDFVYVEGYLLNKFGENQLLDLIFNVIVMNFEKREGLANLRSEYPLYEIKKERLTSYPRILSDMFSTDFNRKKESHRELFFKLFEKPLILHEPNTQLYEPNKIPKNIELFLHKMKKEGKAINPDLMARKINESTMDTVKSMVFNVLKNEIT